MVMTVWLWWWWWKAVRYGVGIALLDGDIELLAAFFCGVRVVLVLK